MSDSSRRDFSQLQGDQEALAGAPQKGAGLALPHSERLYSTLVNSLGGIVWEADGKTFQFTFVSEQAEQILGYPVKQWLEEPNFWRNHTHPDDAEWCAAFCLDATAARRDHDFEYRMIAADGRIVWLHDIVSVKVERDGSAHLRGIMLDITERKLVKRALRESEDRWAIIFNEAALGIALVEASGHPIQSNPAFQRMLGYTEPELRRMTFAEFTHPDDVAGEMALYQEILSGKRNHYKLEKRYVRKDGEIVWVTLTASVIRDESGQVQFGLGIVEDITERKQAREALLRREEYFQTLIENVTDNITVVDRSGVAVYESPSVRTMTGYQPEELVGKSVFDLIHPDDLRRVVGIFETAMEQGGVSPHVEYRNRHRDGSWHFFESIGTRFVDETGQVFGIINTRDITRRKEAETALRESEGRLKLALDAAGMGTWDWDISSGHIEWSEELRNRFSGLGEQPSKNFEDFLRAIHPLDRLTVEEAVRRALEDGDKYEVEYRVEQPDGSFRWLLSKGQAFFDESGKAVRMSGINIDITRRRRAEEQLREAEERIRMVVNSAPLILFACDEKGMVTLSEGEGLRGLGLRPGELVGQSVFDVYGETPFQEYTGRVSNVRQVIGRVLQGETVKGVSDVNGIYHDNQFMPAFDKSGRVMGVVCVSTDITERKRMEDALTQSEHDYRKLFEQAHDAIIIFEPEHQTVLEVNGRACELYGYPRAEFVGMSLAVVSANPTHGHLQLEEMLKTDSNRNFETVQRRKDGSEMLLEINAAIIEYKGRKAVLSINRDVTERKRLEDQLRQAQKMEAVGQLAGGVAHDFNNLLTAINGYSDLALRKLKVGDPLRHNLEEIRKAGDRAATLTRQLLAFSRKQVLQPQVLNINVILSEMVTMLPRLIGEHIDLQTAVEPEIGSIKADPGQIEQVIMNLIVNARDAMPEGGKLTIETQNVYLDAAYASLSLPAVSGHYVMISVKDTGIGMDENTKEHIFEPFFTTKEAGKGTGLGLSTVYGIVKQSGGYVFVESEAGAGATFKVYLPRVDERAGAYHRSVGFEEIFKGNETILLAEDDEMVRGFTLEVLEMSGYRVLEAANGGAALLICEQHQGPIHLLLTDVVMPEMSGRVLAERLLRTRPEMAVLYMSGYTDDAIVQHGVLEEGMSFIQKPFTPNALASKVREILDAS